ncbi:MAG: nucleoside triphosphate pyrophosphohydrolase [Alphaproteobacteria bacterium]|jgi:MazG family protein
MAAIDDLIATMAKLRDPDGGCPWDLVQDFASIKPYTIEEAYEVGDAIDRGDRDDLKSELGDLLFQVVYHAQMAAEEGSFAFEDVARAINDKMLARHPHVFGDAEVRSAAAQTDAWEKQKAGERAAKAAKQGRVASVLDDVPVALPALMRAEKLGKRAARVGFDWPDALGVTAKLREELDEVDEAFRDQGIEAVREEVGDLLFAMAQLARKVGVDAEEALRLGNIKFAGRFQAMEAAALAEGSTLKDEDIVRLEQRWNAAKLVTHDE